MKRNWDLVRTLLLDLEEEKDVFSDTVNIPKWNTQTEQEYRRQYDEAQATNATIFGHLELLLESGLADGFQVIRSADGQFSYGISAPRLTMAGHDLLDTMRSTAIWESIKSTAKTKSIELTFDAVKALGVYVLKNILSG